jgi:dienelactone hydrolase
MPVLGLAVTTVLAGCGGSGANAHIRIAVKSASALADAPARIEIRGLAEHGSAALHARWRSADGWAWTSTVPVRASAAGVVRLDGVDGMRVLWGMRPLGPPFKHPFFAPPAIGPSPVALSVTVDGRTVARSTLERRVTRASVRARKLSKRRDGVDGALFTPRGHRRRPAVVVFGGSEGGNRMADVAGLLAAHGYPTLALAYFGEPGLPSKLANIPLEYFARAARVLRRRPQVDPHRIVVLGDSRGGEAALLVAATFPGLIHGAIGLVPSDSVYPSPAANLRAWTLHGRPVPLEQIPVERINGPVLTVGAGLDQVWSSKPSVISIEHRLRTHGFGHEHGDQIYENAGHLIGTAMPYTPEPAGISYGGTPRANATAKAELWPQILAFLARL